MSSCTHLYGHRVQESMTTPRVQESVCYILHLLSTSNRRNFLYPSYSKPNLNLLQGPLKAVNSQFMSLLPAYTRPTYVHTFSADTSFQKPRISSCTKIKNHKCVVYLQYPLKPQFGDNSHTFYRFIFFFNSTVISEVYNKISPWRHFTQALTGTHYNITISKRLLLTLSFRRFQTPSQLDSFSISVGYIAVSGTRCTIGTYKFRFCTRVIK